MNPGAETITIIKRTPGIADPLGIPADVETETDQPGCSFQPHYGSEWDNKTDFSRSVWVVYAPPTPLILGLKPVDAVRHSGVIYEVFGDPMPWVGFNGSVDHVRFLLRKARG